MIIYDFDSFLDAKFPNPSPHICKNPELPTFGNICLSGKHFHAAASDAAASDAASDPDFHAAALDAVASDAVAGQGLHRWSRSQRSIGFPEMRGYPNDTST